MDKFIGELASTLAKKNMTLNVSKSIKEYLLNMAYIEKMGARAVSRAINSSIKKEIAKTMLRGESFDTINVDMKEDKFIYSTFAHKFQ